MYARVFSARCQDMTLLAKMTRICNAYVTQLWLSRVLSLPGLGSRSSSTIIIPKFVCACAVTMKKEKKQKT